MSLKIYIAAAAATLLYAGCGCSDGSPPPAEPKGARPPTPRVAAPANGAYTGHRQGDRDLDRPVFVWDEVAFTEPVLYQLEVDDDCQPGPLLQQCAFPSPEIRERAIDAGLFRPDEPLPVSKKPPLGRRYYYRLRACAGARCSPWTRIRYLEVGRTRGDFDGDGRSDVAVGAPLVDDGGSDRGAAFVYFGNRGGIGRMQRLPDPKAEDGAAFGVALSAVGDVNGDGYADLVVGAAGAGDARGRAYLYRGGPDGFDPIRFQAINPGHTDVDDWFGSAIAGAGDIDGDGYADVLIGASGTNRRGRDWGVAYAYRGGPGGLITDQPIPLGVSSARNYDHFGFAVAPAGDLNGDGFDDVAVGSPGIDAAGGDAGTDRGAVYLFFGSAVGLLETAGLRLEAPVPLDFDRFGWAVDSAGDINLDGYSDLVVGAPGRDDPDMDGGAAYLYLGSARGITGVPDRVLQDPGAGPLDRLGTSVAGAGDLNGDGFADVVVGTSSKQRGRALVYYGSREGIPPLPALRIEDPLGAGYNDFAETADGAGDVNGDGFDDLIIGASGADNGGVFRGSIVLYPGTADGVATGHPLRRDDPDDGEHDHFGHIVSGR